LDEKENLADEILVAILRCQNSQSAYSSSPEAGSGRNASGLLRGFSSSMPTRLAEGIGPKRLPFAELLYSPNTWVPHFQVQLELDRVILRLEHDRSQVSWRFFRKSSSDWTSSVYVKLWTIFLRRDGSKTIAAVYGIGEEATMTEWIAAMNAN
jgi:hypothetical protein